MSNGEKMHVSSPTCDSEDQRQRPYGVSQESTLPVIQKGSLGAGTALPWGAMAVCLTTLALHHMGWRGDNMPTIVYVGDFLLAGAVGMVVSAQWELAAGNGFAYSMFSLLGLFFGSYGLLITPTFGVAQAFQGRLHDYHNVLGIYIIVWAVPTLGFLLAALPTNVVSIGFFFFLELAFMFTSSSHFAYADGHTAPAIGLTKTSGYFQFIAGLFAWYWMFYYLMRESLVELPLGVTSRYFGPPKKLEGFGGDKFQ